MPSPAPRAPWFRFVGRKGLVVGDVSNDIRVPHSGNTQHEVTEGAFRVLEDFQGVDASTDAMKALTLRPREERAFATFALAIRSGERTEGQPPAATLAANAAATVDRARRGDSWSACRQSSFADVFPHQALQSDRWFSCAGSEHRRLGIR